MYPGERSGAAPYPRRRRLAVGLGVVGGLSVLALAAALVTNRNAAPAPPSDAAAVPRPHADDWPARAAEADRAVRGRDPAALAHALDSIRAAERSGDPSDPARAAAVRHAASRVGKALAFRERITDRGLVLGTDGWATSVVLSPDDRWLAVGQSHGDAGALVFDSYTGEKRHTVWPRRGTVMTRVHALAFARDGEVLAAATADTRVLVTHLASGNETTYDPGPGVKRVAALAVSPATQTLVAGLEPYGEGRGKPYLKAWNLDTGKEPFAFKHEHLAQLGAVGYTAGGHQIMTGGADKRLVMWNADTGRIWRELRCGVTVRAVACHPHGRTLVVAGTGPDGDVIQFWDYAAETLLATRRVPGGACRTVTYTRDGAVLVAGSGSQVVLWDPETFAVRAALTGHSQDVLSAAVTAEGGVLVTGSADQTVRLWDVNRHLPPRPAR